MLMSESLQMTEFSGHKTVCRLAGYEVLKRAATILWTPGEEGKRKD